MGVSGSLSDITELEISEQGQALHQLIAELYPRGVRRRPRGFALASEEAREGKTLPQAELLAREGGRVQVEIARG